MQHGFVALAGQRAQDLAFLVRGVEQHAQRLVRVAGKEHVVEALAGPAARLDDHAVAKAQDLVDRGAQQDAIAERRHQFLHVARRAAAHHAPHRPVVHGEHAVVMQEADEELRGEAEHALGIGRPDRGTHRDQVVLDEAAAVLVRRQVIAQRHPRRVLREQRGCLAVEAQDFQHHAVEGRPQQVAALREQPVDRGAVVLQSGVRVAHGEAHGALLPLHAQLFEQRDEVRVRAVVVHDETRVDPVRLAFELDAVRVRVAAHVVTCLEHGDRMPGLVQAAGDDIAGDAGPDDRDLHACSSREVASRTATGTGRRSWTMPAFASSFRIHQVASISHQKKPWRAEAG